MGILREPTDVPGVSEANTEAREQLQDPAADGPRTGRVHFAADAGEQLREVVVHSEEPRRLNGSGVAQGIAPAEAATPQRLRNAGAIVAFGPVVTRRRNRPRVELVEELRPVHSPRFKVFMIAVLTVSALWLASFTLVIPRGLRGYNTGDECRFHERFRMLPSHNPAVMRVYLLWLVGIRLLLFSPRILSTYHAWSCGGFAREWCARILVDGPMYNFMLGISIAILVVVSSPASPVCEEMFPGGHQAIAIWTSLGGFVCSLWVALACWQNAAPTRDEAAEAAIKAWARSLELSEFDLEDVSYDESVFGDEDGKLYPAMCPICVDEFMPADVIKVTRCQHAFHADCIGKWLRSARTCAMCRQDLAKVPPTPRQAWTSSPPTGLAALATTLGHLAARPGVRPTGLAIGVIGAPARS